MCDNIVVTSAHKPPLWVMSVAGKVISRTELSTSINHTPETLSVSPDGVTYVTHYSDGIYESKDNGKTWSLVIKKHDNVYMYDHAVRVLANKDTYDVWTIVVCM